MVAPGCLPPGGRPAAPFRPRSTKLGLNRQKGTPGAGSTPETGLALKDDPALAWVTLLGEVSLFDLIDDRPRRRAARPLRPGTAGRSAQKARTHGHRPSVLASGGDGPLQGDGRGLAHGQSCGCRSPAARTGGASPNSRPPRPPRLSTWWMTGSTGPANFRRAGDEVAALEPGRRPRMRAPGGSGTPAWPMRSVSGAPRPRGPGPCRTRRPTCCWPPQTAVHEDWDALVRRGIFLFPLEWGEGAAGTVGVEDIFQLAEVANGAPRLCSLAPRSLDHAPRTEAERESRSHGKPQPGWFAQEGPNHRRTRLGSRRGRLVIDTPYTQGMAGWFAASRSCSETWISRLTMRLR